MAGLSSAPEGADAPVDHEKAMRKAFDKFKTRQEWPVNEEAYKQLEGDELVVARNWRNMSPDRRNLVADGLIGIQEKLEKGAPVAPKQLEGFRTLEKVLPKVFGANNTIDSVMDNRRVARRAEGELQEKVRLEDEEGKMVLQKLDDDLQKLPPEAEGSQLDGTTQDEPLKKPE